MIGRLFDAIEQGVQRPMCWIDGHRWKRSPEGGRVCTVCGARRTL